MNLLKYLWIAILIYFSIRIFTLLYIIKKENYNFLHDKTANIVYFIGFILLLFLFIDLYINDYQHIFIEINIYSVVLLIIYYIAIIVFFESFMKRSVFLYNQKFIIINNKKMDISCIKIIDIYCSYLSRIKIHLLYNDSNKIIINSSDNNKNRIIKIIGTNN